MFFLFLVLLMKPEMKGRASRLTDSRWRCARRAASPRRYAFRRAAFRGPPHIPLLARACLADSARAVQPRAALHNLARLAGRSSPKPPLTPGRHLCARRITTVIGSFVASRRRSSSAPSRPMWTARAGGAALRAPEPSPPAAPVRERWRTPMDAQHTHAIPAPS